MPFYDIEDGILADSEITGDSAVASSLADGLKDFGASLSDFGRFTWNKVGILAAAFWPPLRILHLWPITRFAVKTRGRSRMVQRPHPDLCVGHRVTDVPTAIVWCERSYVGFIVDQALGGLARIRWNRSVSQYCPERSWASSDAMRSASNRSRFPARTPGEVKEVE